MTATELLRCPFCGKSARHGHPEMDRFIFDVTCSGDSCSMNGIYLSKCAWNRRSQPEPQAMSAEEVREACAKVCDDNARESRLIGESEGQKTNRKAWLDFESAEKGCALAVRSLDLSRKEKV